MTDIFDVVDNAERYKFALGAKVENSIKVDLDKTPLAIPRMLLSTPMSAAKLEERYRANLAKAMEVGTKGEFMFLLELHKYAKQKGTMAFICNCKGRAFHAKAVEDYITENWNTLEASLAYIDPQSASKDSEMSRMMQQIQSGTNPETSFEALPSALQEAIMRERQKEDLASKELVEQDLVIDTK